MSDVCRNVEALRHLVNQGMGDNTLRALTSDLAYLEAWGLVATGSSLPWPAPEALLLKFVAQRLWDPRKRANDDDHGMPADVDENLRSQRFLKSTGPHAPSTVRRRLGNWSTLTKWRALDGALASPPLKSAPGRSCCTAVPRKRSHKSAKAVTRDVLAKLLAACATDGLRDLRARAILTRSHGAITSQIRSASIKFLQQCRQAHRTGCTYDLMSVTGPHFATVGTNN
jgi:integrase